MRKEIEMTREIIMYQSEYERIVNTIKEIEDVSLLHPRTLEDAKLNLKMIKDLAFQLHDMMRISGHS